MKPNLFFNSFLYSSTSSVILLFFLASFNLNSSNNPSVFDIWNEHNDKISIGVNKYITKHLFFFIWTLKKDKDIKRRIPREYIFL